MQVISPIKENSLSEIGQHIDVRFSFAIFNKKESSVQRLHEYVKCRDFLGDILWASIYNTKSLIYGFVADETRRPDKKNTSFLLKFKNKKLKEDFLDGYKKVLHPYEKVNKLKRTKVIDISDTELLTLGDKFWQSKIWLVSLYTFLLKVATQKYSPNGTWMDGIMAAPHTNERGYLTNTKDILPNLFMDLKKWADITTGVSGVANEEKAPIHGIHNSCGFVSVIAYRHTLKNSVSIALQKEFPKK